MRIPEELAVDLASKFVGKVCTVLTNASVPHIKDPLQHAQYFTGQVVDLDEYGVTVANLSTKKISWFSFPVAGILEEKFVAQGDKEAEAIVANLQKKKERPVAAPNKQFVPVEKLTEMLKKVKKTD